MSDENAGSGPPPRRTRGLFELAWQLPPDERVAFVQRSAGDDADLASSVLSLLQRAQRDGLAAGRTALRAWLDAAIDEAAPIKTFDETRASAAAPRRDESAVPPKGEHGHTEGQSLGDFQLLRPVDEGGTGVVWLARQRSLGRQVALKTFRSRAGNAEAPRQQFLRAAQLAARLQHPHIVSTYTAGMDGDTLYYVMEYVEGVTLERLLGSLERFAKDADDAELLRLPAGLSRAIWPDGEGPGLQNSSGSLRLRARSAILRRAFGFMVSAFAPVVEAIEYAHRQGIVHGDIKPANLILDRTGRMLVLDFGLARSLSLIERGNQEGIAGTPRYMSPELVAGQSGAASRAIDVYALGATLYEILALAPAYDGPSREAILAKIATENPTPLREANPRVHRDLGLVVERAMHRQPKRRYPTAGAMANDLRRFLRRQPLASSAANLALLGQRAVHDHPMASVVAMVALVGGLGFGIERGLAWIDGFAANARAQDLWQDLAAAVADARACLASPGEGVGPAETNLERATQVLLRAKGRGLPAEVVAERRACLMQEATDIRVRAYMAAGEPQLAFQFLQEAERELVDTTALLADLTRSGALATLDVRTTKPAQVTVALRRVNELANTTEDAVVRTAPSPASFASLFPGQYAIEVSQHGAPPIQFALRVDAATRTTIEIPYAPAEVPAGMAYVPCSDTVEFVCGDHDTQFEVGSFGPLARRLYRSYFLDRLEVTNQNYARFLDSPDRSHCLQLALTAMDQQGQVQKGEWLELGSPLGWTMGRPAEGTEEQPVQLTQWWDALAYAQWRQADLPTGLEWEFAARGIGSRIFPYGDDFVLANHFSVRLAAAGSHPKDVSVHGIFDLLGSVPELVLGPVGSADFAVRGARHDEKNPYACRLAQSSPYPSSTNPHSIVDALVLRMMFCLPSLGGTIHRGAPFGFRCRRDAASPILQREAMR